MAVLFLWDKVPSQASSQEPTSTLKRKHVHDKRCWCTPNLAGASHGGYSASMYQEISAVTRAHPCFVDQVEVFGRQVSKALPLQM